MYLDGEFVSVLVVCNVDLAIRDFLEKKTACGLRAELLIGTI